MAAAIVHTCDACLHPSACEQVLACILLDESDTIRLQLVNVSLVVANEHVAAWHRNLDPVIQDVFQVGAADNRGVLRAVAIVENPKARGNALSGDYAGRTLEVTRLASDGVKNACSMLYGACARATFALGYLRVITYNEKAEGGASLRAAGYRVVAQRPARKGWHTVSRPRDNNRYRSIQRQLWEKVS